MLEYTELNDTKLNKTMISDNAFYLMHFSADHLKLKPYVHLCLKKIFDDDTANFFMRLNYCQGYANIGELKQPKSLESYQYALYAIMMSKLNPDNVLESSLAGPIRYWFKKLLNEAQKNEILQYYEKLREILNELKDTELENAKLNETEIFDTELYLMHLIADMLGLKKDIHGDLRELFDDNTADFFVRLNYCKGSANDELIKPKPIEDYKYALYGIILDKLGELRCGFAKSLRDSVLGCYDQLTDYQVNEVVSYQKKLR